METRLIITIDTEVSGNNSTYDTPDRQFYGMLDDNRELGIHYIMDTLDKFNWKCTFFVNVFDCIKWGEDTLKKLCNEIIDRGFDVQLHTHIEFLNNEEKSYLAKHSFEKQIQLIEQGRSLLQKWTGVTPLWHRAGHLSANQNTLKACKELNLCDSSYAHGWPTCENLKAEINTRNNLRTIEGTLELPITTFETIPHSRHFRTLDINSCVLSELNNVTDQAIASETPYIILLMHSFSFVRRQGEEYIERSRDINRFETFLRQCQKKKNLIIGTLPAPTEIKHTENTFEPTTGFIATYINSLSNFSRSYKNKIISFFPFVLLLLIKRRK